MCSDDEEDCMEEVQHVLKRIMAQKKATSRKKIAQIEQACHFWQSPRSFVNPLKIWLTTQDSLIHDLHKLPQFFSAAPQD